MFIAKGENVLVKPLEKETMIGSIIMPVTDAKWKQRNVEILSLDENNPSVKEMELKVGDVVRLPEGQIFTDSYCDQEIFYIKARSVMFVVPKDELEEKPKTKVQLHKI